MSKTLKYAFVFVGLILGLFLLQYLFWYLYLEYWDFKVTGFCDDSAGTTVLRIVELSESDAIELGLFRNGRLELLTEQGASSIGARFYFDTLTEEIKESGPRVVRRTYRAIDGVDESILGEYVTYSRVGGGPLPSPYEVSSYSCSDIDGFKNTFEEQVFKINQ